MKITIIGAGAMGGLFGTYLHIAGHEVRFLVRQQSLMDYINGNGIRLIARDKEQTVFIPAVVKVSAQSASQLTIVCVKSMDTRSAAQSANITTRNDGWVLTLQNGMGNGDILADVCGGHRVIAGSTANGATVLEPGLIRHAGVGPTVLGRWETQGANDSKVDTVSELFNSAGLETRVVQDVRRILWEKLLINVGINAITALTGIMNGRIVDHDETRWISRTAVDEAALVAKAAGIELSDGAMDRVFQVALDTAQNRSSMGQDVDRRRQTEIGAINGFVVEMADRFGIAVPVNRTLFGLIRTLESTFS
jgi:2-dehydropantoate 2-reductase